MLEASDRSLHEAAHEEVKPCSNGKTLLLEEMARASGFSTPSLLGHLLRSRCPAYGPFRGQCGAKVTKDKRLPANLGECQMGQTSRCGQGWAWC